MNHILIVEDEKAISDLIKINLTDAGYVCQCAYNGLDAADFIESNNYDLILLDIMLPKINGYELMEYIKSLEIPVIFITAKSSVNDRVKGLLMGAEDYIVKPFEIVELLARVEVVLRRFQKSNPTLIAGNITINTVSRLVYQNNSIINLTPKEYELLLLLIRNKNISLFRDKIAEKVWGQSFDCNSRTLDLHIQRLRKKLKLEKNLKAIYKVGYRLDI